MFNVLYVFCVICYKLYIYYIQEQGRLRPPLFIPDDTADPADTAGSTAAAVATEVGRGAGCRVGGCVGGVSVGCWWGWGVGCLGCGVAALMRARGGVGWCLWLEG
jgi:hypothetical protein